MDTQYKPDEWFIRKEDYKWVSCKLPAKWVKIPWYKSLWIKYFGVKINGTYRRYPLQGEGNGVN